MKQRDMTQQELATASPPAWGRGLKLISTYPLCYLILSPPAWGRGLKRVLLTVLSQKNKVAPRVGAWIETNLGERPFALQFCRPPRGGVD